MLAHYLQTLLTIHVVNGYGIIRKIWIAQNRKNIAKIHII
jgi:hypothetical protein